MSESIHPGSYLNANVLRKDLAEIEVRVRGFARLINEGIARPELARYEKGIFTSVQFLTMSCYVGEDTAESHQWRQQVLEAVSDGTDGNVALERRLHLAVQRGWETKIDWLKLSFHPHPPGYWDIEGLPSLDDIAKLSADIPSVDTLLDDGEEVSGRAGPEVADRALASGVGSVGKVSPLVLDDEKSPVVQLGDEVGVESDDGRRKPEAVAMTGDVPDPVPHFGERVDLHGATHLIAVRSPVEGRNVVGTEEVLGRSPGAAIRPLAVIHSGSELEGMVR